MSTQDSVIALYVLLAIAGCYFLARWWANLED